MFWEKKEDKKGLPELPPMRPLLSFDNIKEEKTEEKTSFSSAQESSVSGDELPELPSKFKAPKMSELEEPPMRKITPESTRAKTEDVYIKIDRFHSARRALNSARDKLKDIDELMRKIRDTKMREEQELASWEDEISAIKSKVEDVTKNIFEKIE